MNDINGSSFGIKKHSGEEQNEHDVNIDSEPNDFADCEFDWFSDEGEDELAIARENIKKHKQERERLSREWEDIDVEGDKQTWTKIVTNRDDEGVQSDYIDSDDPGSYKDTSDESDADDAQRVKSSGLHFSSNGTLTVFFVDQIFTGPAQFKKALSDYSLEKQFTYHFKKNDKVRVRAKCSALNCKWEILASIDGNDKLFKVKTYYDEHSCLPTTKNPRLTSKVIAIKFKDDIVKMPFMKARHIRALVKKKTGVVIDYPKARRAKLRVMKQIQEQYIDEFKRLREYADELVTTNPGTTIKLEVDRENPDQAPIFHRMYICFGALKENFKNGCRPMIGLDGCFLKGLVKGQLLTAIGRDGNNQMFPIAWAVIAGVENTEHWKWFVESLMVDLDIIDGLGWTVISDMQKVSFSLVILTNRLCMF